MEEPTETTHSSKLRFKTVERNILRIQSAVEMITPMYDKVTPYDTRFENKPILLYILMKNPDEIQRVKLTDDKIAKMVCQECANRIESYVKMSKVGHGEIYNNFPF